MTEKNTNSIDIFTIDRDGLPSDVRVQAASGVTPFGFAFGRRDQLFVTEAFGGAANGSAASSYRVTRDGMLDAVSISIATNQTSACWAAVTPDGRFLYVTNTGSGSVTGYAIDSDGRLTRLDADGRTGVIGDGSAPIDVVISGDGRFLYNVNSAAHTITGFSIQRDGALLPVSTTPVPANVTGLASR